MEGDGEEGNLLNTVMRSCEDLGVVMRRIGEVGKLEGRANRRRSNTISSSFILDLNSLSEANDVFGRLHRQLRDLQVREAIKVEESEDYGGQYEQQQRGDDESDKKVVGVSEEERNVLATSKQSKLLRQREHYENLLKVSRGIITQQADEITDLQRHILETLSPRRDSSSVAICEQRDEHSDISEEPEEDAELLLLNTSSTPRQHQLIAKSSGDEYNNSLIDISNNCSTPMMCTPHHYLHQQLYDIQCKHLAGTPTAEVLRKNISTLEHDLRSKEQLIQTQDQILHAKDEKWRVMQLLLHETTAELSRHRFELRDKQRAIDDRDEKLVEKEETLEHEMTHNAEKRRKDHEVFLSETSALKETIFHLQRRIDQGDEKVVQIKIDNTNELERTRSKTLEQQRQDSDSFIMEKSSLNESIYQMQHLLDDQAEKVHTLRRENENELTKFKAIQNGKAKEIANFQKEIGELTTAIHTSEDTLKDVVEELAEEKRIRRVQEQSMKAQIARMETERRNERHEVENTIEEQEELNNELQKKLNHALQTKQEQCDKMTRLVSESSIKAQRAVHQWKSLEERTSKQLKQVNEELVSRLAAETELTKKHELELDRSLKEVKAKHLVDLSDLSNAEKEKYSVEFNKMVQEERAKHLLELDRAIQEERETHLKEQETTLKAENGIHQKELQNMACLEDKLRDSQCFASSLDNLCNRQKKEISQLTNAMESRDAQIRLMAESEQKLHTELETISRESTASLAKSMSAVKELREMNEDVEARLNSVQGELEDATRQLERMHMQWDSIDKERCGLLKTNSDLKRDSDLTRDEVEKSQKSFEQLNEELLKLGATHQWHLKESKIRQDKDEAMLRHKQTLLEAADKKSEQSRNEWSQLLELSKKSHEQTLASVKAANDAEKARWQEAEKRLTIQLEQASAELQDLQESKTVSNELAMELHRMQELLCADKETMTLLTQRLRHLESELQDKTVMVEALEYAGSTRKSETDLNAKSMKKHIASLEKELRRLSSSSSPFTRPSHSLHNSHQQAERRRGPLATNSSSASLGNIAGSLADDGNNHRRSSLDRSLVEQAARIRYLESIIQSGIAPPPEP